MRNIDEILKLVGDTADFPLGNVTDVNQKSGFGDTPLHIVSLWGDVEAVEVLIVHGANVNEAGEEGKTPLFSAIMSASVEVVKYLLSAGADPLIKDSSGFTALQFAHHLYDGRVSFPFEMISIISNVNASKT